MRNNSNLSVLYGCFFFCCRNKVTSRTQGRRKFCTFLRCRFLHHRSVDQRQLISSVLVTKICWLVEKISGKVPLFWKCRNADKTICISLIYHESMKSSCDLWCCLNLLLVWGKPSNYASLCLITWLHNGWTIDFTACWLTDFIRICIFKTPKISFAFLLSAAAWMWYRKLSSTITSRSFSHVIDSKFCYSTLYVLRGLWFCALNWMVSSTIISLINNRQQTVCRSILSLHENEYSIGSIIDLEKF